MCIPKVSISLNVGTFKFFSQNALNSDSGKNLAGVQHEFAGIRRNLAGFDFFFPSLFLIFLGPKLVGEE